MYPLLNALITPQVNDNELYHFSLQALSAKSWSHKGRQGKGKHFTLAVKEQVGLNRTWDFGNSITLSRCHTFINHFSQQARYPKIKS